MNPQPAATVLPAVEPSLLEAILSREPEPKPLLVAGLPLVGECLDDRHPTLLGRYLVRSDGPDGVPAEQWLASLYGLAVRRHDRVLLVRPGNWPEPVIVGVIDGFARRPEVPAAVGASLELRADEVIRVHGSRGEPLVEVRQAEGGPIVRLLAEDANLEMPGKLKLAAKSIELQATFGGIKIAATDDVRVTGESISLN